MARRRPAFKRSSSQQYGWATIAGQPTLTGFNASHTEILVAGDADIEVRAIGNTHCNLKRIIGDIVVHPWAIASSTYLADPVAAYFQLYWAIMVVDNDDDTSQYAADSATVLSEERVLAHGVIATTLYRWNSQNAQYDLFGDTRAHIDVKSNRRLRSDDDIVLQLIARGTEPESDTDVHQMGLTFRSLLKFPG